MVAVAIGSVALVLLGIIDSFWLALVLISLWALSFSAAIPIRQAYMNGIIESDQRATVLSVDALMGSAGGVVAQPALGRAADVWSYSLSFGITGIITAIALPFYGLARRENAESDPMEQPQNETAVA